MSRFQASYPSSMTKLNDFHQVLQLDVFLWAKEKKKKIQQLVGESSEI